MKRKFLNRALILEDLRIKDLFMAPRPIKNLRGALTGRKSLKLEILLEGQICLRVKY